MHFRNYSPLTEGGVHGASSSTTEDKKMCSKKWCIAIGFGSLAFAVFILYVVKGMLLTAMYTDPLLCENETVPVEGDDSSQLQNTASYPFTVGVYAFVSVIRCIEYIPLIFGLYQFCTAQSNGTGPDPEAAMTRTPKDDRGSFQEQKPRKDTGSNQGTAVQSTGDSTGSIPEQKQRENTSKGKCCAVITMVLLVFIFTVVLLLALSIPAVGIALENTQESKRCKDQLALLFYIYCAFNFFRYFWSFTVRAGMVVATLRVREVWRKVATTKSTQKTAVALHASLTREYMDAGKKVKNIANIFQSWFLFPWIIFALESYLEAGNVLSPWNGNKEKTEILPVVYLLLFNINQVVFLLISYICGQMMNHYHHVCHNRIQEKQLSSERSDDDLAEQRKLLIQQEYDYDFVPRFWGLGFKVKMNSMIYILFLLFGIFFTACGAMV